MTEYDKIRSREVLCRIAELKSLGMDLNQIKKDIEKEFNFSPDVKTIQSIIRQYSIRGTEFAKKDQDMAELYKNALKDLLEQSGKNVNVMSEFRDKMKEILELIQTANILEGGEEAKKFRMYLKEIQNIIRTLDNSISTYKGVLELLDRQKKEFNISAMQSTEQIMEQLEDLEQEGLIVINPKLKKKKKLLNETEN